MSKISELAQALYAKTLQKKIKWEVIDDLSISTNIGVIGINLTQSKDARHQIIYVFSIQNLAGITVDEEIFPAYSDIYEMIGEMMVRARRDSLRADETIDELLEKIHRL